MAKHSKFDNIKHRKAAQDAKKWKIYSIHAKLIALAASSEWDPQKNPNLAMLIEKAKKDWVPNENIDRAIKKWTWENKDWVQIIEIIYEWYAAGWVAIIITVLTDNRNRTASNIRHIFSKTSWNMWEPWSVSWMFKRKWIIIIDSSKYNYQKIEELILETDSEDIILEWDIIKIITSIEDFNKIEQFLYDSKIEIESSSIDYIPDNKIEITDFDKALKIIKMIEAFDEDEDVISVTSNEIIDDILLEEVYDFIEKNTFKT